MGKVGTIVVMPYAMQDFLQAKSAYGPTFSADGKTIAFLGNLGGTFQIYAAPADAVELPASELRRLTDFEDAVSLVRFSPTNPDLLVFARDRGGDEMHQLYTLNAATGDVRDLTDTPTAQHNFGAWSPDGTFIAYASTKRDGTDYDAFTFEFATGEEQMVASLGGYCGVVSISPSGRYLVLSAARGSFLDTDLYLVDLLAQSACPRLLTSHAEKALYAQAEWLPDESGFYTVSDDGADTAGVRFVNVQGGTTEALASRWPVELIALGPHGGPLIVLTNQDGYTNLAVYSAREGNPAALHSHFPQGRQAGGVVGSAAWSVQGDRLALASATSARAFNVWAIREQPDGSGRRAEELTAMPADVPSGEMVEPELIRYDSFDGLSVPALFYLPRDARADAKLPAVVYIHGGPEGQFRPSFNPVVQYFAHQGYAVIAPNVRGSEGYGKAYLALDDRDKRLDSVRDLEWLHRWIEQDGRIDPKRVALMGGSYGGYMVLAGLAFQPELWAAGVDIVGIANLVTFLENTSPYRRAVREAEYGYLATDRRFLASASPINKAGDIRAPLFIIHGANDPRVPLSEAEQMRDTLAARGIHAELLVYPDEGHGLAKLKNRLDAYPKVAEFLAQVFAGE